LIHVMVPSDFVPRSGDHFSPLLSFVCVWGVALIPAVVLILLAMRRVVLNRALGRAVDDALDEKRALRAGPAVVRGRVVLAEGEKTAVRVEIDQIGTETRGSKGGYTHAWNESARRVIARPFLLELPSGEILPVTPNSDVLLVDRIDTVRRTADNLRTLSAELTPGEEVWAAGVLVEEPDPRGAFAGYRDVPKKRLVLRGAGRRQRLELSSQPRGDRYRARARFHQRWIAYALVALGIVHGTIFFVYHARTFAGRVSYAHVVDKREYWTRSGKSSTHHHRLDLVSEHGRFSEEASKKTFRTVGIGDVIAIRSVGERKAPPEYANLGPTPTANGWGCLFGGLAIVLLLVGYNDARQSSRPWWDRPVQQRGNGRLASSVSTLPKHDG
jgi:hypothetical protein